MRDETLNFERSTRRRLTVGEGSTVAPSVVTTRRVARRRSGIFVVSVNTRRILRIRTPSRRLLRVTGAPIVNPLNLPPPNRELTGHVETETSDALGGRHVALTRVTGRRYKSKCTLSICPDAAVRS